MKEKLRKQAVEGSYDELCIMGDWYINMEVLDLSYEEAGELTNKDKKRLYAPVIDRVKALFDTLFKEWAAYHGLSVQ